MLNKVELSRKHNLNHFGKGNEVLLFAHGFGCDQTMWRHIHPHFEKDYQIVLFDYVGFGKSDSSFYSSKRYESLNGYADDIVEICKVLALENVTLIGHSVSAMIAVLASKKLTGIVKNLVLVAPSPRYLNDKNYYGGFEKEDIDGLLKSLDLNFLGWSSQMAPVIMGESQPKELQDELTNSFCKSNPRIASEFARATFYSDNREDIKGVSTKTLIFQCRNDVIAPTQVGEFVHANMPNSELHLLDTTGHCPNLSAPKELTAVLKEFLTK